MRIHEHRPAFKRWSSRLLAGALLAAIAVTPAMAAGAPTTTGTSNTTSTSTSPTTGKPEGAPGKTLGLGLRAKALEKVVARLTAKIEAETMNPQAAANVQAVIDRLTALAASEGAENEEEAAQAVGVALEAAVAAQSKSEQHYKLLGQVYKKLGIEGVHVYVKGKKPEFDAQPFIRDGRTLVPVRAIVAALGAEVKWEETTRTVIVIRGDKTVQLQIDSRTAVVNGQPVELDVAASITNSRTFVPLRFLSEILGTKVAFDEETKLITVNE